jgi:hypothetical protein
MQRGVIAIVLALLFLSGALLLWRFAPRAVTVSSPQFPEELVYVRAAKPIAIVWMHGWGVNFYSSTYVLVGHSAGWATVRAYQADAQVPADMLDFFGERAPNPGVTRITAVLKSSMDRQPKHPKMTTAMIGGADHMYTGEETQVAQLIATWIDAH